MSTEKHIMAADLPGQVLSELTQMGIPVTPESFSVWYRHLSGEDPALSSAIAARRLDVKAITTQFVVDLHEEYLLNSKTVRAAENSSRAMMSEIDGIVELIRLSLGSSSQYSSTLSAMLGDILTTSDPAHLRRIVRTLVKATEEIRTANEGLEKGLRAAKSEVEDLRRLLEETRQETLTDPLTGISNRRHFEQELNALIDSTRTTRKQFALLMIDIDHFKAFNDSHGHLTGDKVLRVVAQALRAKFPGRATVARYGGEEFVVILPDGDLMAGWVAGEAARQSILGRELVKRSTGERIGRITISVGVGGWKPGDTSTSLIARADAALLHAKRNGRNCTSTEDSRMTAVA